MENYNNKLTCGLYSQKKEITNNVLDVIAVISNPAGFERRYQLFNEFCQRMEKNPLVRLTSIELQQRARPFKTNAKIKLRSKHEIWYKENLINVATRHYLPDDWEYLAWIDTDLEFLNKDWATETLFQLQTYSILQLFTHAIDLGPNKETLQVHTGFAYQFVNGENWKPYSYANTPWHPGYAWACKKSVFNKLGGLIDFAILGSADHHMSLAFIGKVEMSLPQDKIAKINKNYKELLLNFQDRCNEHIKQNIGYVNGTILHNFHGCKSQRKYKERWWILVNNDFDPLKDIKQDHRNLYQLENNKPKLRDDIRRYFRVRNEDSCDRFQNYTFVKKNWV